MVIDASVGVKWIVPEAGHAEAAALLDNEALYVPLLFYSEVGNALLKKSRRREIDLSGVADAYGQLRLLVTTVDEAEVMPRALALASDLRHSIYDCVYIALAERIGVPLATADRRFLAKIDGHLHGVAIHALPVDEGLSS